MRGHDVTALTARLNARTAHDGEHLLWTGAKNSRGYGHFYVDRVHWYAHRAAWVAVHGPIPAGLVIDHLCRVRACVSVEHLRVVSHAVNIAAGDCPAAIATRRGTCLKGHPYDYSTPAGYRRCRTCDTERRRINRRRVAGVPDA